MAGVQQPWMKRELFIKFGRTVKKVQREWSPKSNDNNPFKDSLREDIDPLPIEKRIRYWMLARGDRVRVVRGELKGKEGVIKAIDQTRNQVIVAGLNIESQRIPKTIGLKGDPPYQDVQYPLEYQDLRLVYDLPRKYREKWRAISNQPLINTKLPAAGWRVVIDKLVRGKPYFDPRTGRETWKRIVPGLGIQIPWPKLPPKVKKEAAEEPAEEESEDSKEEKDEKKEKEKEESKEWDTPSALVLRRSFNQPTLYYPPLPEGIELELHNQYSRFKRQKFARAKEQMAEWRRRYEPGIKEQEELQAEVEMKNQNVYTSEQLRIRAVNKLVKKARKMYFKRKELTDDEVLLIAGFIKARIESKMKGLIGAARAIQPLTPLEQAMSPQQRLAHRRQKAVLDKEALEERKKNAVQEALERDKAAKENKGRNKVFEIEKSATPPVRKTIRKKKRTAVISPR